MSHLTLLLDRTRVSMDMSQIMRHTTPVSLHVHHVAPHVVAEALATVPWLTGSLTGHGSLAGSHPFHRPHVQGGGGGGGPGAAGVVGRGGGGEGQRRGSLGRHGAAEKAGDKVWKYENYYMLMEAKESSMTFQISYLGHFIGILHNFLFSLFFCY